MHETPDLDSKDPSAYRRFDRYEDLTRYLLGRRAGWWALVPFQMAVLVGICITYTVVGGDDLFSAVAELAPGMKLPLWSFYLMFAGAQLILSQLPDFSSLGLVSLLGALMSVGYCVIAAALAIMHGPAPNVDYSPLAGSQSVQQKIFSIFTALSTLMFAVSLDGQGSRRQQWFWLKYSSHDPAR